MKKQGFTVAEVTITLVILGIIACITIPSAYSRYLDSKQRTQIKKAISTHSQLLQGLQIDSKAMNMNALITAAGAGQNGNCEGLRQRLKVKETDAANSCIIKAPSGLWYDYSNLSQTIVAFKRGDLLGNIASAANDNRAFYFVADFDERKNLHVLNPAFTVANTDYYRACEKVYNFIKIDTNSGAVARNANPTPPGEVVVNRQNGNAGNGFVDGTYSVDNKFISMQKYEYDSTKTTRIKSDEKSNESYSMKTFYDKDGKLIFAAISSDSKSDTDFDTIVNNQMDSLIRVYVVSYNGENYLEFSYGGVGGGTHLTDIMYDKNGNVVWIAGYVPGDKNSLSQESYYTNDPNVTVTSYLHWYCSNGSCSYNSELGSFPPGYNPNEYMTSAMNTCTMVNCQYDSNSHTWSDNYPDAVKYNIYKTIEEFVEQYDGDLRAYKDKYSYYARNGLLNDNNTSSTTNSTSH